MKRNNSIPLALVGLLLVISTGVLSAGPYFNIVTPPEYENVEGRTRTSSDDMGIRFQQLIGASSFGALPAGGVWIRGFRFRLDSVGSSGSGTISGAEVSFSTTKKTTDSLSALYAENIGADNQVFIARSTTLDYQSGLRISPGGPQEFSGLLSGEGVQNETSKGFFYNPANGNLLIDFKDFGIRTGSLRNFLLDAVTLPGSSSVQLLSPSDPINGRLFPKALIMSFEYEVPEPSAGLLLVAGIGVLGISRFFKS